jgi:hypothetical protein
LKKRDAPFCLAVSAFEAKAKGANRRRPPNAPLQGRRAAPSAATGC